MQAMGGGRLLRKRIGDFYYDVGAQHLCGSSKEYLRFVSDHLQLRKRLIRYSTRLGVLKERKIHLFDTQDLFRSIAKNVNFLSARESLQLATRLPGLVPFLGALRRGPDDLVRLKDFDHMTAREWANRHFTPTISSYVADNMLESLLLNPPEQTSASTLLVGFSCFAAGPGYTLPGGYGEVAEVFFDHVKTHANIRWVTGEVREVVDAGGKVNISLETGERIEASKAILAVPAPIAKRLLKNPTPLQSEAMDVTYSPTVTLTLLARRDQLPDYTTKIYGIAIPSKEEPTIGSAQFKNAGSDHVVIQTFFRFTGDQQYWNYRKRSAADLTDEFLGAMERQGIVSLKRADLEAYVADPWDYAMPIFTVGRSSVIERYRNEARKDRILLVGDYLSSIGTAAAYTSAVKMLQNLPPKFSN